jgi:VanZ family protein
VSIGYHKWREAFFAYAPLFLWIGVIFYMSSGAGAFEHTSRFIGPLLAFLFPDASAETLAIYHVYIRKFAHFGAYGILALLAWRAFRNARSWPIRTLGVVLVVAVIDEINQSYNSSRTGTATDVLLDLLGGAFAVCLVWLVSQRRPVSTRST